VSKPRVLISTDIGGADPDDIQSMVHALLYADEFKLVGLVSTPTKHGGRSSDIHKVIDAYAQDYNKLKTWSSDYPTPEYLRSITKQGSIPVAPSKGWSSPTEGSKAIIKAAHEASSSDPLWVLTWGSMTDLAQALHDDPSIQGKIKVYSIGAWNTQQDPASRDYIYNSFKNLWWIENDSTFRGMYVDDAGNAKNTWKMGDAQGHGTLGETFYKAMPWGLKMGDTPSLLYLLDNVDNNNPGAASWGGSFVKTGHGPNYWTDKTGSADKNGPYNGADTVQDHQGAFYKDFVARLDRAKAAKTGGEVAPKPTPTPTDPPGGDGGALQAVDDAIWKTGANETMWQNARYLTWNDEGGSGELKVSAVAAKSAAGGTVNFGSDGTIKFIPKAGWQGKDWVEYTVKDATGATDTGKFYVQVGTGTATPPATTPPTTTPPPTAEPPQSGTGKPVTAVDDDMWKTGVNETMWQNARYLTWNDKGGDGALKVSSVASKSAAGGTIAFDADGTMTYRPKAGWQGKDSVQYTVKDADGSSDTGTFYVQVGQGGSTMPPAAETPTPATPPSGGSGSGVEAKDDSWGAKSGAQLWFNSRYLLSNDKAPDGGLAVKSIASTTVKGGTINWDADTGTTIYRSKAGYTGKDYVEYTAVDRDGSTDTALIHFDVLIA